MVACVASTMPVMAIHPGLTRFFDPLVRATTWGGPLPQSRDESAGFEGEVNLEFTGDDGWTWHCIIAPEGVCFRRGGGMQPVGTVSMKPDTFFKLLRGDTSFSTAAMTGRVRTRGDGHVGMMVGVMVARFRSPPAEKGVVRVFSRFWKARVLSAIEE